MKYQGEKKRQHGDTGNRRCRIYNKNVIKTAWELENIIC